MWDDLVPVVNGSYTFSVHPLPVCAIVKGKVQVVLDRAVAVSYPGFKLQMKLISRLNNQQVPGSPVISRENLIAFLNYLEMCTAATTYTNIMNDQRWMQFYGFGTKPICYSDGNGGARIKHEEAVPCSDCDLIVRKNLITVDHQRPQAGNDLEPICKVFRAVGLTVSGPTGAKGKALASGMAANIGGTVGPAVNNRDTKYSLNEAGTIYLSLFEAIKAIGDLKSKCLNHFANLQPLCHSCNSPFRNLAYFP